MLDKLTMDSFSGLVGDAFEMEADSPIELELVKARPLPEPNETPTRTPFALEFRGPADPIFPQRIYRLTHPKLGSLDLFLVPVGPGRAGMLYEAVFN